MDVHIVVAGYMIHDGKVLLVLHNKLKLWLPPGGHIEKNETPDDAVIREFKEETNIDAELLNRNSVMPEGNMNYHGLKPVASIPFGKDATGSLHPWHESTQHLRTRDNSIKQQLAVPFYANVHNVGDHDHCCLFYMCAPKNPESLRLQAEEISGARWFSLGELDSPEISPDVRNIAKMAFQTYKKLRS